MASNEVGNLFMAGPCIFPIEGASNPTYTIFAAALRGAEHLAEHWGSVAGKSRSSTADWLPTISRRTRG
jgi:choline dehydrogenase-like flavoprotein